jgi:hypothetical protein
LAALELPSSQHLAADAAGAQRAQICLVRQRESVFARSPCQKAQKHRLPEEDFLRFSLLSSYPQQFDTADSL